MHRSDCSDVAPYRTFAQIFAALLAAPTAHAATVFGLQIRSFSVYIDPDGDLGASYTSTLAANAAAVRNASKLGRKPERGTSMGVLSIAQDGSAQLTCLVYGAYDERDYQEP